MSSFCFFRAAIKKCPAASAEGHYFGPRALRGSDPVFPDLLAGDFQMGFAGFLDEVDQGVQSLAHNRPFRKTTERDARPLRVGDGCISINQPWVNHLSINPRCKYKPQSFWVHPLRGTQRQTATWPPMSDGAGMPETGKWEPPSASTPGRWRDGVVWGDARCGAKVKPPWPCRCACTTGRQHARRSLMRSKRRLSAQRFRCSAVWIGRPGCAGCYRFKSRYGLRGACAQPGPAAAARARSAPC